MSTTLCSTQMKNGAFIGALNISSSFLSTYHTRFFQDDFCPANTSASFRIYLSRTTDPSCLFTQLQTSFCFTNAAHQQKQFVMKMYANTNPVFARFEFRVTNFVFCLVRGQAGFLEGVQEQPPGLRLTPVRGDNGAFVLLIHPFTTMPSLEWRMNKPQQNRRGQAEIEEGRGDTAGCATAPKRALRAAAHIPTYTTLLCPLL